MKMKPTKNTHVHVCLPESVRPPYLTWAQSKSKEKEKAKDSPTKRRCKFDEQELNVPGYFSVGMIEPTAAQDHASFM